MMTQKVSGASKPEICSINNLSNPKGTEVYFIVMDFVMLFIYFMLFLDNLFMITLFCTHLRLNAFVEVLLRNKLVYIATT